MLLCGIVILGLYWPVLGHDFVNFDDNIYVFANERVFTGFTWTNIIWAFTTITTTESYWHPLTWVSHMLDSHLFGLSPGAHHLTNVWFHLLNCYLLMRILVLYRARFSTSLIAVLLFAVHPLQLESVAWVSSRKTLLCSALCLTSLLFYSHFLNSFKRRHYLCCLLAYGLSILCKQTLVCLPFVLLALDLYRRRSQILRFWPKELVSPGGQSRLYLQLVVEKLPFFVLAALGSCVAMLAHSRLGLLASLEKVPLSLRIANAFCALTEYAQRTVVPVDLSVFYPYNYDPPVSGTLLSLIVVCLATTLCIKSLSRRPAFFLGSVWVLVSLLPVLGLVKAGEQSSADRFMYFPLAGIAFMFAVSATTSAVRGRALYLASFGGGAVIMAMVTAQLLPHWRNSMTLMQRACAVTTDNYLATANLGAEHFKFGQIAASRALTRASLAINPSYVIALHNLGLTYLEEGRTKQAELYFSQILTATPATVLAHRLLAETARRAGNLETSVLHLRKAIAIDPNYGKALVELATILAASDDAGLRDGRLAVAYALRSLDLSVADDYDVMAACALAHAETGDFLMAISYATRALNIAQRIGDHKLILIAEKRLAVFRVSRPWRFFQEHELNTGATPNRP